MFNSRLKNQDIKIKKMQLLAKVDTEKKDGRQELNWHLLIFPVEFWDKKKLMFANVIAT